MPSRNVSRRDLLRGAAALTVLPNLLRADGPPAAFPPPGGLGELVHRSPNLQRTMRLLATSTPERQHEVRILFYGQSITEQAWWKLVVDDLKQRFPNANLIAENRAIGGHSSQLLVKTAEADLYPFQPDLLIFHVYGAHDKYEDIIRGVRERTAAEILMQNDHVTRAEAFDEETDPAKLAPGAGNWDAFMNHNWLPAVARKYGAELCDQRTIWKRYLKDNKLEPAALLKDGVHLNAHGEFLMAECVKAYLQFDEKLGPSPAEAWVTTHEVGKDLAWQDGKLQLDLDGGRVAALVRPGSAALNATVRLDGKRPSLCAGTIGFTRTSAYPGMNWPCLLRVQAGKTPLVAEDWTLTLHGLNDDCTAGRFDLRGSVTGDDGSGSLTERFVSKSGRVVIDPDDWNLAYGRKVRRTFDPSAGGPPDGFAVTWKAELRGVDDLRIAANLAPADRHIITLAQGLPKGPHALEIEAADGAAIKALRVYRPPLLGA